MVAISGEEDKGLGLCDIDIYILLKLRDRILVRTLDGGISYYVTSVISLDTGEPDIFESSYLRKDGLFYNLCGENGLYSTRVEAEESIRRFFHGAGEMVIYKDGSITKERIFGRHRIGD